MKKPFRNLSSILPKYKSQGLGQKSGAGAARDLGDVARNQGNWPQAVFEYQKHLAAYGHDQAIWVQLGHALKESGDGQGAVDAYKKSIALSPENVETYHHLSHLLVNLNRVDEASVNIEKAIDLWPQKGLVDLYNKINSTNLKLTQRFVGGTYFVEIDDVLDYLRHYKTLSGIQRVQVGIIRTLLEENSSVRDNYMFVRSERNSSNFWRMDPEKLLSIFVYIAGSDVDQSVIFSRLVEMENEATYVKPSLGQIYLVLGAFWAFGANASKYVALKDAGVSVGVYLYDLIPISYPEYCSPGLVEEFALSLGDGLASFDFILTISEFVANDVRAFIAEFGLETVPVRPVLLAHELHASGAIDLTTASWGEGIQHLRDRKFVLMVSTIEARKNHIYLYNVWKELIKSGLSMPDLVFVGRFGWRMNDFKSMLEDTDFLGGHIHVLHDISDVDLEILYNNCEFTVFPSVVEGWGLPVGESLAHGKVCVASNTSSIPEVGGELVDYLDPLNIRSGMEVISNMISNEDYRRAREQEIKTNFVARTWKNVTFDMIQELETLKGISVRKHRVPSVEVGKAVVFGDLIGEKRKLRSYLGNPVRTMLVAGWYQCERGLGVWMAGCEGRIQFLSPFLRGHRIVVLVDFILPPWIDKSFTLSARSADDFGQIRHIELVKESGESLVIDATVGEDGVVSLIFDVDGDLKKAAANKPPHDPRLFYFGVKRLIYFSKFGDTSL